MMRRYDWSWWHGVVLSGLVLGAAGCQWVADVDRDLITEGDAAADVRTDAAGGGAGTGGAGGIGGAGGAGGQGPAECTTAEDCPVVSNPCIQRACEDRRCTTIVLPETTELTQTEGDCIRRQCNGDGEVVDLADATDIPDDSNQCTVDSCEGTTPKHEPTAKDSPCGATGNLFCDGEGNCTNCTAPTQCDGTDTFCAQRTCTEGVCGFDYKADGTSLPAGEQTAKDCKQKQCNGSGGVKDVLDNVDKPDDAGVCKQGACDPATMAPIQQNKADGTQCGASENMICKAGECQTVACTKPADCPQAANAFCGQAKCEGNVCGMTKLKADGTPLPAGEQTAKDCKKKVCSGDGASVANEPDNSDVPDSAGPCKVGACVAGEPVQQNKPEGEACVGPSGEKVCRADGTCVQCVKDTDCASGDEHCVSNKCVKKLFIVRTDPVDGATNVALQSGIHIEMSADVNPGSLIGTNNTYGDCTGGVRVRDVANNQCVPLDDCSVNSTNKKVIECQLLLPLFPATKYEIRVGESLQGTDGGFADPSKFSTFVTTSVDVGSCTRAPVVINSVYPGGGVAGATYKRDYVVLRNRSSKDYRLASMSLQVRTASGVKKYDLPERSLPAGKYLLIGGVERREAGAKLPGVDLSWDFDLPVTGGSLMLVEHQKDIGGPQCKLQNISIIDDVSWGGAAAGTPCADTAPLAGVPNAVQAVIRKNDCVDSRSSNNDFQIAGAQIPTAVRRPRMCVLVPSTKPTLQTRSTGAISSFRTISLSASGKPWMRTATCMKQA